VLPPPPPRCAAEAPLANRSAEDAECRVVVEDISARKRAEQALRQQTEELRRRNETLTRFNPIATGRELRLNELKREVNERCSRLNEPPRPRSPRPADRPQRSPRPPFRRRARRI
jgi:hypothetical protein